MTRGLDIRTLGGLRVKVDGARAAGLGSRTAEALLVYLAVRGRPVARERLAELFWPERAPETSQANLRGAVHRLRQAFTPFLLATRQQVGVDPSALELDAAAFERLVEAGRAAEAMELYRGGFLEGFAAPGSPAFEDWVERERVRLHDLAVAALQTCLSAALAEGQSEGALSLARRLLALEPFHEPTHRVLMRCLTQTGRRAAALAHAERYRALLANEMGLELEPATLALLGEVRRGEDDAGASPGAAATRYDVALPGTPLLGRWVELEGLLSRLETPDCRLVTVLGPGGVGKTRLALQAAHDAASSFADGALFVPLAGVTDESAVVPSILQSLGVSPPPGRDAKAQLLAFLRRKRLLLVLDNLEQLIDSGPLLLELLRHAPGLKLLVTSRERLALSEEWLAPLGGLSTDEAAAMFVQSAERAAPETDLSDEAAIREVCTLVEGVPLAIELAAPWAGLMRPGAIAGEIRASLDFLSTRLRDLPERHRSVRGLFDASWRLLGSEEQAVFGGLSVFRGGFTADAARAVAGASVQDLRAFCDKSLLRADGRGRFALHELIRQYAHERLAEAGAAETAARRHFLVYTALAEEADRGLFGKEQPTWRVRLETEQDNFRAALGWGFAHAETREAARLVIALSWFWRQRAFEEAGELLERALRLEGLEPAVRALLLYHRGHVAWMQSDWGAAEAHLSESLTLWADVGLGDGHGAGRARCSLAMTRYMQGRPEEACALIEPALNTFRAEDDPWWTAFACGWLGKAGVALGELDAAKAHLSACLEGYRHLGNPWGLGLFLGSAAQLHLKAGNFARARALAEESRALLAEIGHKHALGAVCWTLGLIAKAEGRPAAARAHYEESLAVYRELGLDTFMEQVAGELAELERNSKRR